MLFTVRHLFIVLPKQVCFIQEIYADFKQYESIHFENMIVECRHLWNKQYSVTRNVRN